MREVSSIEQLRRVVSDHVGPVDVVAERSWSHGEALVIEVRTGDDRAFIAKQARRRRKFTAELTAYQRWVPALGDCAPELIAYDSAERTLVLSKVPGEPSRPSAAVLYRAGRLLKRFHTAEPGVQLVGFVEDQHRRLDEWVERAEPGVLDADEVSFVREQIELLRTVPDPIAVPCHRDWQPRNWLTTADKSLSVIDFEHARLGPWVDDLQRLWWDEWRHSPRLARAFFDGYGADLDDADRQLLRGLSTLSLLTSVVWANEHADEAFGRASRRNLHLAIEGAPDPI